MIQHIGLPLTPAQMGKLSDHRRTVLYHILTKLFRLPFLALCNCQPPCVELTAGMTAAGLNIVETKMCKVLTKALYRRNRFFFFFFFIWTFRFGPVCSSTGSLRASAASISAHFSRIPSNSSRQ